MYDWANSAFVTTVSVAALPIYFSRVIVGDSGVNIGSCNFSATSLWGFMISFSALFLFFCAPVLGAIADFSGAKKKFLMFFCYLGTLSSLLLFFCNEGDVWRTVLFFVVAEICFVGGNVFYDAFLPEISPPGKMDYISGKGYAYGYVGGGVQFALSLGLITAHDFFGISEKMAVKLSMAGASLWWGGFALFLFIYLKEKSPDNCPPAYLSGIRLLKAYVRAGIVRTISTARKTGRFKHLLLFLIAFMIYNDGIQTVISMATIYGAEELKFSSSVLMTTLLLIQFIAFFGALFFGKLGELISAKKALIITLFLWSFVVIYAYFLTKPLEYYILGIIVGVAMGGSQSLSRSLYGSMIPAGASAEFFGFFSVFNKFSCIWGPLIFGMIDMAGSARYAILSLIAFFIVGLILLLLVNVEEGAKAGKSAIFAQEYDWKTPDSDGICR